MRAFLALVDKDWRDARAVVIGVALLVPAAIYGAEAAFTHWQRPEISGTLACCIVVLFAAVLCADLVASDRISGRAGTFALLPIGGSRAWLAKVVFAAAAVSVFAAWTALVALLLHASWADPMHVAALLERAGEDAPACALLTVAAGGSALLFSTLLPRALPAAILGIASSVGAVALLLQIDMVPFEQPPLRSFEACALAAAAGVLLALGALLVHARRCVHTGSTARRVALGLSLLVGAGVPAGAAFAGTVCARTALSPGDDVTYIVGLAASPDGRYLAATVTRWIDYIDYRDKQRQRRVWIIDVASGSVCEVPGRNRATWTPAFTPDGRVRIAELTHSVRRKANGVYSRSTGPKRLVTVDPEDGRVLALEPYLSAVRRTPYRQGGWCDEVTRVGDVSALPLRFRVRSEPLGIDTEVDSLTWISVSDRPGHVLLQTEEHVIVQRDLTTGKDVFRFPVGGAAVALPVSDVAVAVCERLPSGERMTSLLDAATGEVRLPPLQDVDVRGVAGEWVQTYDLRTRREELANVRTGARRPMRWPNGYLDTRGAVIPGLGTAIVDGPRIIVLDDFGNVIRTYLDAE